jgi:hypothetical protein
MTSRLFRAIVGVGISLGTASAACLGAVSEGGPSTADAPGDVILDAFCDAAWPTTKGNPSGPTCGPIEHCAEAGPAPHCYRLVAPSTCDSKPRPRSRGASAGIG